MRTTARASALPARAILCAAAVVLAGPAALAQHAPATTHGSSALVQMEREGTIELDGSPERVFALLDPAGQNRWSDSRWQNEPVFPPTGDAREGAVFRRTIQDDFQGHRAGQVIGTILVVQHEAPRRYRQVEFMPDTEIWEIDVALEPAPGGRTVATVKHRITALDDDVNDDVNAFFGRFDRLMERWRTGINAALSKAR